MLISQNQCNVRLPKYNESVRNIIVDCWKCITIFEKAHLISNLKKKVFLAWGSNSLWNRVLSKMDAFYFELILASYLFHTFTETTTYNWQDYLLWQDIFTFNQLNRIGHWRFWFFLNPLTLFPVFVTCYTITVS